MLKLCLRWEKESETPLVSTCEAERFLPLLLLVERFRRVSVESPSLEDEDPAMAPLSKETSVLLAHMVCELLVRDEQKGRTMMELC